MANKSSLVLSLVIVIMATIHQTSANGCDGARRLSCHIHCNLKGYQCDVHTCKCEIFAVDGNTGDEIKLNSIEDMNSDHAQEKVVMVVAPMATWVYILPTVFAIIQLILIAFAIYKCGLCKNGARERFAIVKNKMMRRQIRDDIDQLIENGGSKGSPYSVTVAPWDENKETN